MLNILFNLPLLLILPLISQLFWPQTIILLFSYTFLSMKFLFSGSGIPLILNPHMFFDQMSSPLITLTLWISALMILASSKIFNSKNNPSAFTLMVSSLALILILAFSLSNLINFYIMFESSLIPTLILILSWGYQPERLQAGMYLMMYTITASLPLLLSLCILFKSNGHLSLMAPSSFTNAPFSSSLNQLWWMSLILAFLVKAPIYVFHLWLPKAHVEAPVAGSMILAGLLLKLGSYGLLRISSFYSPLMFKISPICNSLALWGGVLTSMICLRQPDIKSLIAYSSVGHMALIIMGTTLLTPWGWQGALMMMVAHGLCSSCLFSLANSSYEATSTRSIFLTKGLLCLFPSISLWWFLMSIFNMASPPSINLLAEINLLISAIWASPLYMIPLGILSFLSASYSLYLYSSSNHGTPSQFTNPLSMLSTHSHTLFFMHTAPLILIILKPEILATWL
uniref:NADH-ubiquinone oxidoreductase chain 4 n=1 Tax=Lepidonotopodium sp. YZ-2018 TaxID=2153333 RepID=A0A343W687_9ANNE|nr:NADH dehydrogenase subunit 4 [Lepidonotopodium sp. YZ-2018]